MDASTARKPSPFTPADAAITETALAATSPDDEHARYFSTVDERDQYLSQHPDATAWNLDRATGEWHEATPPADDDDDDANTFDMLKVADLMRAKGVYAYCEQTGGGCATIYAGLATEENGYRSVAYDREGNRPFAAGPGSWWTFATARGHYGEFYYGADDQGESEPQALPFDPTLTEEMIAARCVEWYRENVDEQAWQTRIAEENSDRLTGAEREALGLTSYDTRWPHRERDLDDAERGRLAEHRMNATMRAQITTDPEAGGPRDPSLPEVEHDDPSQPAPELAQALASSLVTLRLSPEVAQVLYAVADERYEELRAYEDEIDNGENYRLLGLALNALNAAGIHGESVRTP